MRTRVSTELKDPIVFDDAGIRSLFAEITRVSKASQYTAHCVDGSLLDSTQLDEIVNFENPSFRRIERISCDFHGPITGSFSLGGDSSTARFSFVGDDDLETLKVTHELKQRLREAQPKYHPFSRLAVIDFVLVYAAVVLTVILFVIFFGPAFPHLVPNSNTFNLYVVRGFAVLCPILFLIRDRWRWLFPRTVFLIGRQVEEHERRKFWQNFWMFTCAIGLVLAVVGNLLTDGFKILIGSQ